MELLLNLVWMALALTAYCAFMHRRHNSARTSHVPCGKALLALACVVVLLFPVVSASDDLHPTQAVLEDATKRVQQLVAPLQHVQNGSFAGMVAALLAGSLLCSLVALQVWPPTASEARVINRTRTLRDGRSPPSL